MAPTAPRNIHLSALSEGMPGLTIAWGTVLAEAAAVCLEDRSHKTGVGIHLTGMTTDQLRVEWDAVDDQCRASHNDLQEATEHGACGVAILIVCGLTGKVVTERSKKGPGFDYWLGDRGPDDGTEDDSLLFSGKGRLEISGILEGSRSTVQSRVKEKKEQMKPSRSLAPGYVAVVEFSAPQVCVESA
jgi:hypothetical protein